MKCLRFTIVFLLLAFLVGQSFARGCSKEERLLASSISPSNCQTTVNSWTGIVCLGGFTASPSSGICLLCSGTGRIPGCSSCGQGGINGISCHNECYSCTDQCAADSLKCPANATWNSEKCQCEYDYCEEERDECASLGGDFNGYNDVMSECCRGHCDLCGTASSTSMLQRITQLCCAAGKAPPPLDRACFGSALGTGCGVSSSNLCQNNSCFCLDVDDPQYLLQRGQCPAEPGSSDSGGSSNSGGSSDSGGSSGGSSQGGSSGGSSGSGGNGEDWEYDYNDSLHKIILNTAGTIDAVNDLIACFQMANCKTDISPIVTGLLKVGDSTSVFKEVFKDSVSKIIGMFETLLNKPTNTDTLVEAMASASSSMTDAIEAQTTQLGLDIQGVADLIGVSTDSLIVHLDSIWKSLKPEIQDSILKYQRYADDKFDSMLYGHGKGFGLIDKLIDSSVKYFQGTIAALETLSVEVGIDSGAFSTDTTINPTVRRIDSAVMRIMDTSLYNIWSEILYVGDSVSTLKAYLSSLGDSLGNLNGSLTGAIGGLGDSIGSLKGVAKSIGDSVSKYGQGIAAVGDSVGVVRGAVNGLGDSMSGWWNGNGKGGLDTSGNGVGTGIDGFLDGSDVDGEADYVQQMFDGASRDTALDRIFDTSGIGSSMMDTFEIALPDADSMGQALKQSIEDDYDSLEDVYKGAFDTLRGEMQLINWDSVILSPLAAKVPNTNTCPEECFVVSSDGAPSNLGSGIPFNMGTFSASLGLCRSWSVLGGNNPLSLIRLLLRIIVAVTCVYIGAWFIAGRK